MSNKITTLGYFRNRLHSSGYRTEVVYRNYSKMDSRAWTIVVDPYGASVFLTCYINHPDRGETMIEFYDGGQFIPTKVKVVTNSVEVVMEKLNAFDIVNKASRYNDVQDNDHNDH